MTPYNQTDKVDLEDRGRLLLEKYTKLTIAQPDLYTQISRKVMTAFARSNDEELVRLLGLPKYYDVICYFAEFCDISDDLRKAIEMIEIIEK